MCCIFINLQEVTIFIRINIEVKSKSHGPYGARTLNHIKVICEVLCALGSFPYLLHPCVACHTSLSALNKVCILEFFFLFVVKT